MYLKRIELIGFKSFATKTVLDFLPSCSLASTGKMCGVTAIVGPNGSGKSNVADAIKWAMGEQSLKSLRGKKSEDVIFAGSGKKAQLGSAKVSLCFDNSDKKIPIEFEEVIISRKIHRSGEGEYFINNSRVRLIDVADLLAKAGVGQRSYCIINQGMADAVLNAAPLERRIIIEEAAGVKPFQLKRERSLKKLESTRNNLSRAGDLAREIEPHLRVLRRQSEKAKKAEVVSRELREKQRSLFAFLWRRIKNEKEMILAEKEEMGREEMKLQRKIDDLELAIREESKASVDFESRRDFFEKSRQGIFSKLNQTEKDLAILEAKIEIEKEKARNYSLISEMPVDFPYVREKVGEIRKRYGDIVQKIEKMQSPDELSNVKQDILDIGREIQSLHQELMQGKISEERKVNREAVVDLSVVGKLEKNRKEFTEMLAKFRKEAEANKKNMDELIARDRQARRHFFDLESELREYQRKAASFREKTSETRIRLAKIEVREEDLTAKIKDDLKISDPDEIFQKEKKEENVDVNKYEREIGRLKTLSEQIGAIDPLIIEEYEETKKRYEYLTTETKDLEKAIESLKEVIKEMDKKIKEVFEDTYKKINSEFSKYFRIIFGGGNAELIKTRIETRRSVKEMTGNPDDIAEDETEGESEEVDINEMENEEAGAESRLIGDSPERREIGLEIKACPPGKRISTLNMLSGGERALTSQALLFAIISNSPPPFAVLDEVEAALDEANSKRFGRILTELSHQTQFILITHNRETIRQASVLYGVTMGADGVSKVLSVKLDQVGEKGEIN